ncbi:MAG: hypothetical protein JW936_07040 [Sedimentisphaerales bacterium]|nr:hypothetical protein [Sedimentisphaerales bacterium]
MTKRENLLRTIRRDSPAYVPYRYDGSLVMLCPEVNARPREGGLDDWGVNWIATDADEGSYPEEKAVISMDEVADYEAPNSDWQAITADLQGQMAGHSDKDVLFVVRSEEVLFERTKYLLGTMDFLMACAGDVERLGILLDKVTDYQVQLTEAIMRSGVDGVRFTDDWGMQNALFINPQLWRGLFKPRLQKIYEVVKRHNGIVMQHSCGCIEDILPDLVDLGIDVLDPCQPQSNDIFQWKRQYGKKLSFMGGLDTQTYLAFGEPAEIKTKVKEVLTIMSQGGGYIAAPSHTITLPPANQQAMIDAIAEFNAEHTL